MFVLFTHLLLSFIQSVLFLKWNIFFFSSKEQKTLPHIFFLIFVVHACHVILTFPHSSTGGQCSPVKEMCGALTCRARAAIQLHLSSSQSLAAGVAAAPAECWTSVVTLAWHLCGNTWCVWKNGHLLLLSLMKRTKVSRAEVAAWSFLEFEQRVVKQTL